MAKLITLGSLIDKTVEHYHKHFKELVGISLWLIVASAPFLFTGYLSPLGVDSTSSIGETFTYLSINLLGLLTTTVTSLWIAACLILTIDARAKNTEPDHVALGKRAWKFAPSLFVLSLLIGLGIATSVILLFLPGILTLVLNPMNGTVGAIVGFVGVLLLLAGMLSGFFVAVKYGISLAFAQFFLVLNQEKPSFSFRTLLNSAKASHNAVKGSWWGVAIRLFVPNAIISLIVISVSMAVSLSTTVILSFAAASLSALAIQLLSTTLTLALFIVNALVMPLYSLATYYLYDSIKRN